jgi:hypothetical protein
VPTKLDAITLNLLADPGWLMSERVLHCKAVWLVQEVVRHGIPGEPAVALSTELPKLRPHTVNSSVSPAFVTAAFTLSEVITGASYVYNVCPVPATADTVTASEVNFGLLVSSAAALVAAIHDTEILGSPPRIALMVWLTIPKFIPLTVTDPPPVGATFLATTLTTGESKVITCEPVAATELTVTCIRPSFAVVKAGWTHFRVVAVLQAVVWHMADARAAVAV